MRCLLLSCLLLSAATTAAQSETATKKPLNWAERMFAAHEHDFGVVTRGADIHDRIAITNPFGEAITLHSATSTCGCTAPELSTNLLQPNETGYLNLKLNTIKFTGSKNPNVDVVMSFGNGARTTVRIPIHAYIRGDVTTSEDVVDFGVMSAGQPMTHSMSVVYHGASPWKITGVRNNGQGLAVEVADPIRTAQGLTYQLKVTAGSDLPLGAFERSLVVLTEEPARSYVTLRVRGMVEPKIMVATPVIQLGTLAPGAKTTTRLIVRGRQPFSVEAVNDASGLASVDLGAMSDKAVHVLPLTITAPQIAGHFTDQVIVKITGESAPVTCRIEGEVLASPAGDGLTVGAAR